MGGDVHGRLVAQGHRGVLAGPGQHQAEGPANREAAADDAEPLTGDLDIMLAEQLDDAAGRAWKRAGNAEHQLPQIGRVQPISILLGVDQLQHSMRVDVPWEWELDDEASARLVGVESEDRRLDLLMARRGRKLDPDRGDADLGTIAVLAPDVRVAAWIIPDQDGAQTGPDPLSLQRGDATSQLVLDAGGDLASVDSCGGGHLCGLSGARTVGYERRRRVTMTMQLTQHHS